MKYEYLQTAEKRSVNGSIHFEFESGCLDFKGGEVAFEIWAERALKKENGNLVFKSRTAEILIDNELLEDLKQKIINRYVNRMKRLYWVSTFYRS
ncbi:hypothetical protein J2S78_002852 [Salibacterium salarium]|uniref:hypothetical protein n=1 Tax=Salibacterium salarium TaxID=284579 RepID=UPI00278550CC|nr:hypothetical protein [Salibacterium salarium]MDQ0300405.1 hypothetical protein [Salibacterium salarium]